MAVDDRYPEVNTKVGFEECWKLEGWFSCHHPYEKRALVLSDPPVEHCRECDSTRPPTGGLRSYWPSVTKPQSEHPYLAPRQKRVQADRGRRDEVEKEHPRPADAHQPGGLGDDAPHDGGADRDH